MAMPEPTNEQAAMQQKMMKYMTMFMGIMFYKVASGLCLYFIASSLWGIAERKLLPKPKSGDSSSSIATPTPPSRSPTNGSADAKRAKSKRK
jgi:YidC/Oxa1 family membrane protein insertase